MSTPVKERRPAIERIKNNFVAQVWETAPSELNRIKRLLQLVTQMSLVVARDFVQNLLKLQAMALAFKTLLSLAPLLAVVFSLLKAFGVHHRMQPALAEALAPLGEKGQEITAYLIGFVNKMSAGALGAVGLVTLFVTVLSLMGTIEAAFNHIWRVKSPRKLTRRFSDYLSVILVGPVLVFAALTITATLQSHVFVQKLLSHQPFGTVILTLLQLVPYVTLWGALTFAYVFVPNTRVPLKSALVGGLVAAILWQTVGWGFATFVASSTRYYAIYSSFAILLLFLLWLHLGWVIVLMGAEVAYAHQHVRFYRGERETLAQSPAGREKIALHMLLLVGCNFHQGFEPMNVSELANQLHVPEGIVKELMEMFYQMRLVLPLADEETYVLGRDPARISIKEILDCVRNSGKKVRVPISRNKEESEIDDLLLDVDQSIAETLEGKSLQSLILNLSPQQVRRST
jgi:membrane protein